MDKNKIINSSLSLFREQGIENTNFDDIASTLSISKEQILSHFNSKEELLLTGVDRVIKVMFLKYENTTNSNFHPLVKLSLIYYQMFHGLSQYDPTYVESVNTYSGVIKEKIDTKRAEVFEKFIYPLIIEAQSAHSFHVDVNMEVFLELRLKNIETYYHNSVVMFPQSNTTEILKHLVVYPINGICTQKTSDFYMAGMNKQMKKMEVTNNHQLLQPAI